MEKEDLVAKAYELLERLEFNLPEEDISKKLKELDGQNATNERVEARIEASEETRDEFEDVFRKLVVHYKKNLQDNYEFSLPHRIQDHYNLKYGDTLCCTLQEVGRTGLPTMENIGKGILVELHGQDGQYGEIEAGEGRLCGLPNDGDYMILIIEDVIRGKS